MPRRRYRRRYRRRRINPVVKPSKYSWYNNQNLWDLGKFALAKMFNTERKFIDTSVSPASVDKATGAVYGLTSCAEGSDYNQRTGLSIRAVSMYIRGYMYLPSTATIGHVLRTVLIVDTDNNSGPVTGVSAFFEQMEPNSPMLHTEGARFRVLYDKLHTLSNTGPDMKSIRLFKKLSHHIKYSNSTTGVRDGQMYMLCISDTSTASEEPIFGFDCRIRYVDN